MSNNIHIAFLGTNGWYDTQTGNTTCVFIETNEQYIILDAGNGLYKVDRYIHDERPIYLFLSHFHLDHIIGLHILNKFKFRQGVSICSYQGFQNILNTIINRPYTIPFDELPFKVKFLDLSEGFNDHILNRVKCMELSHSTKCFGYRFELENRVIAYCMDTGVCNAVYELAKNADLLITECSFKSGQSNDNWAHLDPQTAASIARKANTKKLVLTHFEARNYKSIEERKEAEYIARQIFFNTIAAIDDYQIEL